MSTTATDAAPDLLDPTIYANGVPYEALRWLRENDPVHWHEEPNGPGFWALTRYRDIKAMEADSGTFSPDPPPALVAWVPMPPAPPKPLLMSDPPHHTAHRKVLGEE